MLQSIDFKTKLRLAFALIVMIMLLLKLDINDYIKLFLFACAYVAVAYETVISAFKTLFKRFRMSEQFLMSIATFGAIALGDYPEALAVLIFYEIGELFEEYASGRSHKEITSLPFAEEELMLSVPTNDPLASKKQIYLHDHATREIAVYSICGAYEKKLRRLLIG